jgi:hypothetical protein
MITVEKKDLKDASSCNFCSRGVLNKDGSNLVFPYTKVIEIRGNSLLVTMCFDCFKTLKEFLK